jgi:signal transduction histidine kinase/CheY-like chemotaxis protein
MSFRVPKTTALKATNALVGTVYLLYHGATFGHFAKGFIWSLAITSMHYSGILALKIPQGHVTLQPFLVLLSATISWLVCTIGCILIPQIEVNLSQQLIFSTVSAAGVAAKHFTGMWATTFWSRAPETNKHGYPPNLAVAVTSIAILTCMLANGLLAHSATVARNKLAEIVQTKRKLWAAIAQKENAEAAAAARSEFIASASHEIRTPLHQLQGYSDLMSRTELNEEARLLLLAIQQATRSLSMITANVLDWSRLEKGEAVCRPTSLDLRRVCESLLTILPNKDEEAGTELMIVVGPNVPHSLFLDETYLQRILMNLLTNALKFTQSGYVILLVEIKNDELVVTVRDSGVGIPESFLPHLFEPFKQAQTRGAQRGTGLGLAIIRQLLQKMEGTITVESKCPHGEEVGTETSGSTFTVTIPITVSADLPDGLARLGPNRTVALFATCSERMLEGLQLAWKAFGFEVVRANLDDAISDAWGYIWTDLMFLRANGQLLRRILEVRRQLVIVSYDSQTLMDESFGSVPPPHIVPIRRPFLWHRVVENMVTAARTGRATIDRSVRFAPVVDVVENEGSNPAHETKTLSGSTVLLVEDNKINQKLGVKMLKTLGYNAIVADDGQDGIEKLVENDRDIALILMDQSMPRMDGITATRKIREMEHSGALKGKRRPVIMVTAVVGPDAQAMCMSAGTDAFLPKPLALTKLDNTLKKFMG